MTDIELKDFMKAVRRCVNDQCDEKCFLYTETTNCSFKLLDEIMERMNILPEDYMEWLKSKND